MNLDVSKLIAILEAELLTGEALQRNLDAQKQAIAAWDVEALLAHVEAREACLRGLSDLESGRVAALAALPLIPVPAELSQLIAQLPSHSAEHARLRDLQRRSHKTFVCLRAEDESLQALKKNLVGHIHDAMNRLAHQGGSVYGDKGQIASYGEPTILMCEKA